MYIHVCKELIRLTLNVTKRPLLAYRFTTRHFMRKCYLLKPMLLILIVYIEVCTYWKLSFLVMLKVKHKETSNMYKMQIY